MLASDLSSQRRRPEELEETELSPISHPGGRRQGEAAQSLSPPHRVGSSR